MNALAVSIAKIAASARTLLAQPDQVLTYVIPAELAESRLC